MEKESGENKEMSDVDKSYMREGSSVLFLLPSDLYSDPNLNVRPFEGGGEEWDRQQQKRIGDLAASIGERQLDTVLIGPANGNGKYPIVAGNRRVRAMVQENERRTQAGKPLLRVRCQVLDVAAGAGGDLFDAALDSNIQREHVGPVSRAMLIPILQERYPEKYGSAAGVKGLKALARKLGFTGDNPKSSLIQYQKLLRAPIEVKEAVELGNMTLQGALAVLDSGIEPERVNAVIEEARQEQVGKALERGCAEIERAEAAAGGKTGKAKVKAEAKVAEVQALAVAGVEKAAEKVDTAELKKAVRKEQARKAEVEGAAKAAGKAHARSRGEILGFFEGQDGPGNGEEKSAPRRFARYLFETWAAGLGTDEMLQRLWYEATLRAAEASVKVEKPQAASKMKATKADAVAAVEATQAKVKAKAAAAGQKKQAKQPKQPKQQQQKKTKK